VTVTGPVRPQPDVAAGVADAIRDHLPGRTTRTVTIAMSRDDNPKVTVMVFADGEAEPRLALKVGLTPGAAEAVAGEARVLQRLEELDADRLEGTVPRGRGPGGLLVMSAARGVPLSIGYHRWRHTAGPRRVRHDFAMADAWLRRLSRLSPLRRDGEAAPVWSTLLAARWPGDPVGETVAAAVAPVEAALAGSVRAVVHGDFWCGNVLQTSGAVTGVVDWEHASFGADQVRDRVRFALAYSLYLDRHTRAGRGVRGHPGLVAHGYGAGIRYAVHGQGWYPALVAELVGDGLVASGRPRELWRAALLTGLAEIAVVSDNDDFARHHLALLAELLR
jgi:hypothetical protein